MLLRPQVSGTGCGCGMSMGTYLLARCHGPGGVASGVTGPPAGAGSAAASGSASASAAAPAGSALASGCVRGTVLLSAARAACSPAGA